MDAEPLPVAALVAAVASVKEGAARLATPPAVAALVASVRARADCAALAQVAAHTLSACLALAPCGRAIFGAGAVQALAAGLKLHAGPQLALEVITVTLVNELFSAGISQREWRAAASADVLRAALAVARANIGVSDVVGGALNLFRVVYVAADMASSFLLEAGAAPVVVAALRKHSDNEGLLMVILGTVRDLVKLQPSAQAHAAAQLLVRFGAVPLLAQTLRRFARAAAVGTIAVAGLALLLEEDADAALAGPADMAAVADALAAALPAQASVLEALQAAMGSASDFFASASHVVLAMCGSKHRVAAATALLDAGIAEAGVAAMRAALATEFSGRTSGRKAAACRTVTCRAICISVSTPAEVLPLDTRCVRTGAGAATVAMMKRGAADPECAVSACLVLGALSTSEEACDTLVREGAAEAALAATTSRERGPALDSGRCKLLLNLAAGGPHPCAGLARCRSTPPPPRALRSATWQRRPRTGCR